MVADHRRGGAPAGHSQNTVNTMSYSMDGFAMQCVERYLELSGEDLSQLKPAPTPTLDDHQFPAQEHEPKGALSLVCAKIVMKVLFMARCYRYDLLYAVNHLARFLTKWTTACDRKLRRLSAYIYHTKDMILSSIIGDRFADCHLAVFSDADFAGDLLESKSTSGCFVAIIGPRTFAPVSALCKTQSCVSHSSTESEIIALDFALRTEGLPLLRFAPEHLQRGTGP